MGRGGEHVQETEEGWACLEGEEWAGLERREIFREGRSGPRDLVRTERCEPPAWRPDLLTAPSRPRAECEKYPMQAKATRCQGAD